MRLSAILILMLLPSAAQARVVERDARVYRYFCPKYDAIIAHSAYQKKIERSYGYECPNDLKDQSYSNVSDSVADMVGCSSSDMSCLRESVLLSDGSTGHFVYAVPKVVTVGETYKVGGVDFRVDYWIGSYDDSKSVVIYATPQNEKLGRYKMFLTGGRGVVALYFEKLTRKLNPVAREAGVRSEVQGLSCFLTTQVGWFPDTEVEVPPDRVRTIK